MSWTDEELDELYRTSAEKGGNFTYKEEYWNEMQALLPEQRGSRDFLWYFTAILFMAVLTGAFFKTEFSKAVVPEQITTGNSKIEKTLSVNQSDSEKDNSRDEISEQNIHNQRITAKPESLEEKQASGIREKVELLVSVDYLDTDETELRAKEATEESNLIGELTPNSIKPFSTKNELQLLPLHNMAKAGGANYAFYLQSLIGVSQSLVTPSEHISASFGVGAGIAMRRKNFVGNFGLNGIVSNHQDLHLTRSAKVYGFGSSLYRYEFNYKQLYHLEANLEVGYQFKKSEFKIGVRPSYLLSSRVSIASSEYDALSGTQEWSEEQQVHSFTKGLNRWGIKPSVGYAYHLKPDLEFGINLGMQMLQPIDEEFIQGSANLYPIDAQIYLRKNIGRK
jgi:hypothetical protein